eukprot:1161307-Pelagomonas_calceolata.AAC.8
MQASTSGRGPERGGTATAATPLPLSFAILRRRVLNDLSSLPRAIALMAATFAFSALGTFIPQNKAGGGKRPVVLEMEAFSHPAPQQYHSRERY